MNASTTSSGKESFIRIWVRALTRPSEFTYAELAASPRARANTAFLWIFLCAFAPALVSIIANGGQVSRQLEQSGVDMGAVGGGLGAALIGLLCITPFAAIMGVLGFIVSVAVMQWIARMFGGQGNFDKLAYSLGAIAAPAMLVSAVLTLPSLIPFVGICSGIVSVLFSFYLLVLQVMAIKSVNKFGWGAAIGTLIIPGLVVAVVTCCAVAAIFMLMGPAMGDVFSTINQSLGQ